MIREFISCALILVAAIAASAADKELKPLQGAWQPVSGEMAGKSLGNEGIGSIRLTIDGDKYTVKTGEGIDAGTLKLHPSEKPKAMEITSTEGANKGKTFQAIYEVSGDSLKVCYDLSGKARPKEFKTAASPTLFMLTYKRVNK